MPIDRESYKNDSDYCCAPRG